MSAQIRIMMLPDGEVIERHACKTDNHDKEVVAILKQWMEKGDKVAKLPAYAWSDKRNCTPYVIRTADGEESDIFAQLLTEI